MIAQEDPDEGVSRGQTGYVCDITSMRNKVNIGVRWDEYNGRFHTCNGSCENGYGWFVPYNMLDCIMEDMGEIMTSDCSLEVLFDITS